MKTASEYFNGVDLNKIKPSAIVDSFVEEYTLKNIEYCVSDIVWDEFSKFCGDVPPISKQSFHKFLTNNYPLTSKTTSIDGKICRILVLSE